MIFVERPELPPDSMPVWTYTVTGAPICPDLLRLEQLGEADNRRGRNVRLFFRILDFLMPVRP